MKDKKFIDIVEAMLIENHRQLNEDIANLDAMDYSKTKTDGKTPVYNTIVEEVQVSLEDWNKTQEILGVKTTRVVLDSDMKRKMGVNEDYINLFG